MSEAVASEDEPAAAPAGRGARRLFMRQANMRRVIYALVPLVVSGIYFFGWRVLALLAVCNAAGLLTEYISCRRRGAAVSTACFVTCWLYSLSLPPTTPFWIAVVGIVVAILFGKEVFGGFGRNFANPAIVGRTFVYVCFPVAMTARFVPAFRGPAGGFVHWSFAGLERLPEYLASSGKTVADAVSLASPLAVVRDYGQEAWAQAGSLWDMLLGNIGGVFRVAGDTRILSAGSTGEGCAVLIVAAAIYLVATKTANWRLMLSCLCGLTASNLLFRNVLGFGGTGGVTPLAFTLLGGTTMYVTVFMVTDPVSAPGRKPAMYAYGFLIGFLVVLLRWRGIFVAAASFSILMGNLIGPLLDMGAGAWSARRKRSHAVGGAS